MGFRACKRGWLLAVIIGIAGVIPFSGCSLLKETVDAPFRKVKAILPGGGETEEIDPVGLQEDMLRFADSFVMTTSGAADKLMRNGKPIGREELLTIKVALASDVYGLASGSNALANLVGLTVLASGARWRVQDYWLPKVYGVSAEPILQALEAREMEIWGISNRVLSEDMQGELRNAILKWKKIAKDPNGELEAFASNSLVSDVIKHSRASKEAWMPSSVFALLDLDPLAGLDPATRELTETRLFAERALFMAQRMPQLIESQTELLALRTMESARVGELIAGTGQIAAAGSRVSEMVEKLPGVLSSEREKLISGIRSEKSGLADLSRDFGQTLAEGSRMASATEGALKSYDTLLAHIENRPVNPNSEPFRIKDYGETAEQINRMSVQVMAMFKTAETLLDPARTAKVATQFEQLSKDTQARSEAVIDYAFRKALLLVTIAVVMLVISGLLYQWLTLLLRSRRD